MNKRISDMNKRLASIAFQRGRKERGGAGNGFYDSTGAEVDMSDTLALTEALHLLMQLWNFLSLSKTPDKN